MAISSNYKRTIIGKDKNPIPPWRATGLGFNAAYPDFSANESNANGALIQPSVDPIDGHTSLTKLYLFVDKISTGWTIAGEIAQARTSRAWYPRNLTQSELTIEGSMANQYEYDLLVEFVQSHQHNVLNMTDEILGVPFNPLQVNACDFMLFPSSYGQTYGHIPAHSPGAIPSLQHVFSLQVVILNIEAGHERFKFAPAFTITCKVLEDYMQEQFDVQFDIMEKYDASTIFGSFASPSPKSSDSFPGNAPSTTKTRPKGPAPLIPPPIGGGTGRGPFGTG